MLIQTKLSKYYLLLKRSLNNNDSGLNKKIEERRKRMDNMSHTHPPNESNKRKKEMNLQCFQSNHVKLFRLVNVYGMQRNTSPTEQIN